MTLQGFEMRHGIGDVGWNDIDDCIVGQSLKSVNTAGGWNGEVKQNSCAHHRIYGPTCDRMVDRFMISETQETDELLTVLSVPRGQGEHVQRRAC